MFVKWTYKVNPFRGVVTGHMTNDSVIYVPFYLCFPLYNFLHILFASSIISDDPGIFFSCFFERRARNDCSFIVEIVEEDD